MFSNVQSSMFVCVKDLPTFLPEATHRLLATHTNQSGSTCWHEIFLPLNHLADVTPDVTVDYLRNSKSRRNLAICKASIQIENCTL